MYIFHSLSKGMGGLESQKCAFRPYVLGPCLFLLVYCKLPLDNYVKKAIDLSVDGLAGLRKRNFTG